MDETTIKSTHSSKSTLDELSETAVLLVSHTRAGCTSVDRARVNELFIVGRSSDCHLQVNQGKFSKRHFHIISIDGKYFVEDLGSTNGTFVDGKRIAQKCEMKSSTLIRAGGSIFVFLPNGANVLEPSSPNDFGIEGRFHSTPLLNTLREAALSSRHLLISGRSGTGKELAARALSMQIAPDKPFLAHNAAQFVTEEEAATTLFGVGPKIFSGVDPRQGLIEEVEDGVLFLDELHTLPQRLQHSLLRVIENGQTKRIGENKSVATNARILVATNVEDETCGLIYDLFARLRLVTIPTLAERKADIPSIFDAVLKDALKRQNIDPYTFSDAITVEHYEMMCTDGFETDNVRGLKDIADRIATKVGAGDRPEDALGSVFSDRFADFSRANRKKSSKTNAGSEQKSSVYDKNKEIIISTYKKCNGNISSVERQLKERGISCSRRWLAHYIKEWGLKF